MKGEGVLISVIIPVYNSSEYLSDCIKSVINQTYKNLEIIIVDDGSSDSSGEICDFYQKKDSRIKVIHQKNRGPVSARKNGLNIASGEYVAVLDSDDWVELNAYEDLLKVAEKYDADFVECGWIDNFSNGTESRHCLSDVVIDLRRESEKEDILKSYLRNNNGCVIRHTIWSKLYKRSLLDKTFSRIPDYMNLGEDVINFLFLIIFAERCVVISSLYNHYRILKSSLCHNVDDSFRIGYSAMYAYAYGVIKKEFPNISEDFLVNWCLNKVLIEKPFIQNVFSFFRSCDISKKIVLYGLGRVGKKIFSVLYNKFLNYDFCICDNNYSGSFYNNIPVYRHSECLKNYSHAVFLISVQDAFLKIAFALMDSGINQGRIFFYDNKRNEIECGKCE